MNTPQQRQTHGGRSVLTLPGFRKAEHASAPTQAAAGPVDKPAEAQPAPELPRLLTSGQHAALMVGLAQALGVVVEVLPPVFAGLSPRPLVKGIHEVLTAQYPDADMQALGPWLAAWTRTPPYLHRVAMGGPRQGLDGQVSGGVTLDEKKHARWRLKQLQEALKQEGQPRE